MPIKKFDPLIWWLNHYIEDHDLNKLESTLPKYASTQVAAFLATWIKTGISLKIFLNKILIFHCGLNLPCFPVIWFWRRRYLKNANKEGNKDDKNAYKVTVNVVLLANRCLKILRNFQLLF